MRKLLWAALALCLSAPGVLAAQETGGPFAEGNRHYQAGRYEQAASAYRQALASSRSAAVLYNLGNTYFRLGQKGRALAAYERARRLAPRDPDIEWNRRLLEGMLADRIVDPLSGTLGGRIRDAYALATRDELALAAGLFLTLWMLTALGSWLLPGARPLRWLGTLCLLVFFAASGGLAAGEWKDRQPLAVVLDKEIFARYGPSDNERKAFLLHEGALARVADRSRDWVYLTLPDRNGGWVPAGSCEEI